MAFETSLQFLIGWEGGFGVNPHDDGGPTKYGVTQANYDGSRDRKGLPRQSVRLITLAEAEEIYRVEYWDATRCDELNPGLANCVFDADVNSGDRRGVQWLQQAINKVSDHGIVAVDGIIGPQTLGAANSLPPDKLIDAMLTIRLAFMHVARNSKGELLWNEFGRGWRSRIDGVRVQSHKLAGIEMSSVPIPHPTAVPQATKEISMATVTTTSNAVNSAVQSATLSLSSLWSSIMGLFSSAAVTGVLGIFAHAAPSLTATILAVVAAVAAATSAGAHIYSIVKGVSAANNATFQLVENFLNTVETDLGGQPFNFDNGAPANPTVGA